MTTAGQAISDRPLHGIAWVVLGMVIFSIQDVIVKLVSGTYPLHEVVLYRSCFGIGLTMLIIHWESGLAHLKTRRPFIHLLRGLLIVITNSTYFAALASMALAETMAVFFIGPIFITMLSVLFLRERVGWPRWLAIGAGITGVMLIVRPSTESFDWIALLPVVSAFCYALVQILTRSLGTTHGAAVMSFYIQLTMLVFSAIVGLSIGDGGFSGSGSPNLEFLVRAWVWPSLIDLGYFAMSGFTVAIGGFAISQAYRIAPPTTVAPFEYVALPFAILWGFVFWGDLPDALSFSGIILIICGGLFVFYRESIRKKPLAAKRPMLNNR